MNTPELFLQLGIGGAALFVMYKLVNQMVSGITDKIGNSVDQLACVSGQSITTLCNKIDKLVDVNTEMANAVIIMSKQSEFENKQNRQLLEKIYQNTRDTKDTLEKLEIYLK